MKKETFRRGVEGFFCVSGPVIFGAKAQNGKVTVKWTTSMPDGKFHAPDERSKDELLLLGGLLGRLLCGFLSGFLSCHGASPPFLFLNVKVEKNRVNDFFTPLAIFSAIAFSKPLRQPVARTSPTLLGRL